MKRTKENDKLSEQDSVWSEEDATWKLLGKAAPEKAGARFADDVVRSVRLLPDAESGLTRILKFSPWMAAAACIIFATWFSLNQSTKESSDFSQPVAASDVTDDLSEQDLITLMAVVENEERWEQIEDVADVELLAAVADRLDDFSDQELITMIGF